MREEIERWHSSALQAYQALMFETLLHPHSVISDDPKEYVFENQDQEELPGLRGYFASKDQNGRKVKYFVDEEHFDDLPFKVKQTEEVFFKESARSRSVVLRPTEITPFRIKPEQMFDTGKQFFDQLAPFKHSYPDMWTLNKIVAVMGYTGKTFIAKCSTPEFGKSSIYSILDSLTKKCPVFQPRSVPGILNQITGDGNMVFDDIHAVESDVRKMMENFSFKVADNNPKYINGALKSKNTKSHYDVASQSITYLFNEFGNYKNAQRQFWDYLWGNPDAMISRFLRLKFEGKLMEEFDKGFDIPGTAEKNKMFYIKVAKHLLYLKQLKQRNQYDRRFQSTNHLSLDGRHKNIYDEITWGIDMYSMNQQEYDRLVSVLNKTIKGYKQMLGQYEADLNDEPMLITEEEVVETDQQKVLRLFKDQKEWNIVLLLERAKVSEDGLKRLIQDHTLYEVRPGYVSVL